MGIGNGIYRLNRTPEEIISIKILEEKKRLKKEKKCKYHKALGLGQMIITGWQVLSVESQN